jgi:hypothetical protein
MANLDWEIMHLHDSTNNMCITHFVPHSMLVWKLHSMRDAMNGNILVHVGHTQCFHLESSYRLFFLILISIELTVTA